MSTTIPNFLTTKVVSNLDTYVYTIKDTAVHIASCQVNMVPTSGMTIVIKQNASTIATSTAPASAQGVLNLTASINAAANDTISFVLSSSTALDQTPNDFKALLNVHIGALN